MENFILSANIVLPLLCELALGYFLVAKGVIGTKVVEGINKLVYNVFIPCMLMTNIYNMDKNGAIDKAILVFVFLSVATVFISLLIIIPIVEKQDNRRSVLIQAIFRSNFVLYGTPLALALCGDDGIRVISVLIGLIVPLYNILAVLAFEIYKPEKTKISKIILGIIKNPLIIGTTIGFILLYTNIRLPAFIDKTAMDLGKSSTLMAFISLGGSFTFKASKHLFRQIAIGVGGKLLIIPLILLPLAIYLGFRNDALVAMIALFCTPCAVSCYSMAQGMGGDSELAGQLVAYDTIGSLMTVFLFIFSFKQLGLI